MTRLVVAAFLILAGCSPAPPPAKPPEPKPENQIIKTLRGLATPHTPAVEQPKPAPKASPKAVPTPQAAPKKVERPKVKKNGKRERVKPVPRTKTKPVPVVKKSAVEAGPDLPWPCWMVRLNARGKSDAELRKMGKDKNVKLSRKQERQALACLGRK